jgi:hypothetical protein
MTTGSGAATLTPSSGGDTNTGGCGATR